jgi:hypothetical protein
MRTKHSNRFFILALLINNTILIIYHFANFPDIIVWILISIGIGTLILSLMLKRQVMTIYKKEDRTSTNQCEKTNLIILI